MQLRLRTILLLTALLFLACGQLFVIPESQQFKLFLFTLVLLGVPHGALDLYIEQKSLQQDAPDLKNILLRYLLNIGLYAALWYFAPIIALAVFILIAAYHFGEIDWLGKSDQWLQRLLYFLTGLCWLTHFLATNINSAIKIFLYLGNAQISATQWQDWASTLAPISLGVLVLLYGISFLFRRYFFYQSAHCYFALLQFFVLLVFCHYSSLWIGFGFYFGLWHSLLSFDKIRMNFSMADNLESWLFLLKKALPFSVMAWMGMLFVMFAFYQSTQTTSLITLVFITLSVLTLPHLQVFTKLRNQG